MRVTWIRKAHRALGLVIGVQLLIWTLSGLYFSWNDIEKVRGEDLAVEPEALMPGAVTILSPQVPIAALLEQFSEIETIQSVSLRLLMGEPVYEIEYSLDGHARYMLADAQTGAFRSPLRRDEAIAIAQAGFVPDAPVSNVDFVEEVSGNSEYRGRELPAYRVDFDHPSGTRIYVSADRGLVMARRNNTWRAFDFLWMLHIMDYEDRDDINNVLLRIVSMLGVATVLTGYLLWMLTSRTFRGLRKRGARIVRNS